MKSLSFTLPPLFAALCVGLATAKEPATSTPLAESYQAQGPTVEIETRNVEWTDSTRDRQVPAKLYFPKNGDGPFPVIIFSHGLGGSREGYSYLGEHWASHGFVSVHLQHIGSDDSVWRDVAPRERMQALQQATGLKQFLDRPKDVSFAIDQLEKLNADPDDSLKGKLNLKKIGMAGHSFGARTTMTIAGEVFPMRRGKELAFGDPRVKAAIPMSPMPPRDPANHEAAYAKITIPTMHLTGTLDTSPIEKERTAAERLIPYEKIPGEHHYRINFDGGDHMIFSGRVRGLRDLPSDGSKDAAFQELIKQSTTAFWDAWLRDSTAAQAWLAADEGGLAAALGDLATYDHK